MAYSIMAVALGLSLALVSNGIAEALGRSLPFRYYIGIGILAGVIISLVAPVEAVDMEAVEYIESRGNPRAVGDAGEIGLYQIMPIVLKSYNQRNGQNYRQRDLYNAGVNREIADWYLHERIPEMLRYYNVEVNVHNILWAYNAGIGRVREDIMPASTENYIDKYQRITGR